jgi:hypothetical protein
MLRIRAVVTCILRFICRRLLLVDEYKCCRARHPPQDTQGMKFLYPGEPSPGRIRLIEASEVAQPDNAALQRDLGQLGALLVLLKILEVETAVHRA